ncbi:uncharacterized protein LOC130648730 isoform X4 [Hydractinia symbiolongicarpus]|uniref:uncharacterized protein LOC130648730 isoform X4 n=1 Tax=Hydractinia symbiolongicarpus TaxID=13093 RepID=UPI0025500724|nr:uncharacterized protein LOC130648730 isoform X4 [Hydractinia symbiolongicarpus]
MAGLMSTVAFAKNVPTLMKATSDSVSPTPGYLYTEITKITFESLDFCDHLVNFLVERLKKKSLHVKLKVLMVMRNVLEKGNGEFASGLRKQASGVRECKGISGPSDPLHGDVYYVNIRNAAAEVLDILFDLDRSNAGNQSQKIQTGPGKMEGFGNETTSDSSKATITRPSDTLWGFGHGSGSKETGINWLSKKENLSSNSTSFHEARKYEIDIHERETRYVEEITTPQGIRTQPTKQQLDEFIKKASNLDCEVIVKLLDSKLREENSKVHMRCMFVLERLLQSTIPNIRNIVQRVSEDTINMLLSSSNSATKNKAQKLLYVMKGRNPEESAQLISTKGLPTPQPDNKKPLIDMQPNTNLFEGLSQMDNNSQIQDGNSNIKSLNDAFSTENINRNTDRKETPNTTDNATTDLFTFDPHELNPSLNNQQFVSNLQPRHTSNNMILNPYTDPSSAMLTSNSSLMHGTISNSSTESNLPKMSKVNNSGNPNNMKQSNLFNTQDDFFASFDGLNVQSNDITKGNTSISTNSDNNTSKDLLDNPADTQPLVSPSYNSTMKQENFFHGTSIVSQSEQHNVKYSLPASSNFNAANSQISSISNDLSFFDDLSPQKSSTSGTINPPQQLSSLYKNNQVYKTNNNRTATQRQQFSNFTPMQHPVQSFNAQQYSVHNYNTPQHSVQSSTTPLQQTQTFNNTPQPLPNKVQSDINIYINPFQPVFQSVNTQPQYRPQYPPHTSQYVNQTHYPAQSSSSTQSSSFGFIHRSSLTGNKPSDSFSFVQDAMKASKKK